MKVLIALQNEDNHPRDAAFKLEMKVLIALQKEDTQAKH